MQSPPVNATDFLTYTDSGKQLVDPTQFYQAMQLLLGFQQVVSTATGPGPLLASAVNTITSPVGVGPWNIQMPVALGGLRVVIINLGTGAAIMNPSYNVALGRYDNVIGAVNVPSGNVYSGICYQPGFWYVAPVATGLPPGDEPVIEPPPEC